MPRSCILARFSTWDTVLMICKGLPTYQFLIPWWLVGHKRHSLGSWTGWREVLAMNSDHHSINKNIKICTEPKDEKIDPSACYCKTSMPHFGLGTKLSSTYFIGSYKLYMLFTKLDSGPYWENDAWNLDCTDQGQRPKSVQSRQRGMGHNFQGVLTLKTWQYNFHLCPSYPSPFPAHFFTLHLCHYYKIPFRTFVIWGFSNKKPFTNFSVNSVNDCAFCSCPWIENFSQSLHKNRIKVYLINNRFLLINRQIGLSSKHFSDFSRGGPSPHGPP